MSANHHADPCTHTRVHLGLTQQCTLGKDHARPHTYPAIGEVEYASLREGVERLTAPIAFAFPGKAYPSDDELRRMEENERTWVPLSCRDNAQAEHWYRVSGDWQRRAYRAERALNDLRSLLKGDHDA
jgi:hypothetical protein